MLILTIRTDKPEAELGLYQADQQIDYVRWQAHRELAETIHQKITDLLTARQKTLKQLQGLVVFQGPGSFTGLRIGITVANALAAGLQVPIVGAQADDWLETGIKRLLEGEDNQLVLPEYGALPNISTPKK